MLTPGQIRKRIKQLEEFALVNPAAAESLGIKTELRELRDRLLKK